MTVDARDVDRELAEKFGVSSTASEFELPAWLDDAADLLAEPDPGPTPWLVENLIVDRSIVACVGRWKTTKSYGLLDMAISIATGEPAFGRYEIPEPGPVVFVNEESGRTALWRRLDALCRGRAIDPERLRGKLYVAANARRRLDDQAAQRELLELGERIRPRLFVFDPLARMKAARREENAQADMAVLIEFVRELRDQTGSAVGFVHHTGHSGDTMRGSSDLESVWESRIGWKRANQTSPIVELQAEHREAEPSAPLRYRIAYDHETRSMRFPLIENDTTVEPLRDRITAYVAANPNQRAAAIAAGLDTRRSDVDRELANLTTEGVLRKGRSGRRDKAGREIRDAAYTLTASDECGSSQPLFSDTPGTSHGTSHDGASPTGTNQDEPHPQTRTTKRTVARPNNGTNQDKPPAGHRGSVARPTPLGGTPRTSHPDEPPTETDDIPF